MLSAPRPKLLLAYSPSMSCPDDPKDNHVVAAAVETHCEYIVSGDRHLLDLHKFQGIQIVTPREFLTLLAA